MTSLPSVIPAHMRPADLQAMWDTAVGADEDDDAPWQVMAETHGRCCAFAIS